MILHSKYKVQVVQERLEEHSVLVVIGLSFGLSDAEVMPRIHVLDREYQLPDQNKDTSNDIEEVKERILEESVVEVSTRGKTAIALEKVLDLDTAIRH